MDIAGRPNKFYVLSCLGLLMYIRVFAMAKYFEFSAMARNMMIATLLGAITSFIFVQSSFADNHNVDSVINKQTRQIKNLSSRVETLENALFDLRNELTEIKKMPATQASNGLLGQQQPSVVVPELEQHNSDDFMPKRDIVVPKDKQDYDFALATLKEGKFAEAEKQFLEFIRNHPKSKLQSNAGFWYAESLYRQGIYNKAAIHYLQCYKQYPKGAKAADSLLKLSYTLNTLGKSKEACSMLDKLEKEFPNRPIGSIKRATEAKAKFHCK